MSLYPTKEDIAFSKGVAVGKKAAHLPQLTALIQAAEDYMDAVTQQMFSYAKYVDIAPEEYKALQEAIKEATNE